MLAVVTAVAPGQEWTQEKQEENEGSTEESRRKAEGGRRDERRAQRVEDEIHEHCLRDDTAATHYISCSSILGTPRPPRPGSYMRVKCRWQLCESNVTMFLTFAQARRTRDLALGRNGLEIFEPVGNRPGLRMQHPYLLYLRGRGRRGSGGAALGSCDA